MTNLSPILMCHENEKYHLFVDGRRICQCGKQVMHNPPDRTFEYQHTGWICPVCGVGNSPDNKVCPCIRV